MTLVEWPGRPEGPVTDRVANLAEWLLMDEAGKTPGLRLWLVAEARNLPDEPKAARTAVEGRWPALTAEERELAFVAARNVLRGMLSEMEVSLARLELLVAEDGRG